MRQGIVIGGLCIWLASLAGCQQGSVTALLVDFPTDKPLTYKMVSQRKTEIRLTGDAAGREQSHTVSESLELVMEYRAVESDPFGLSTIEGKCVSAKVIREALRSQSGKAPDVAEELAGKTFKFTISPAGRIEDYSELESLVKGLGAKSFVEGAKTPMPVKDPDMLMDFIAMQWYLWDCSAAVKDPSRGVQGLKEWKAVQLLPLPVPIPVARETRFQLSDIQDVDGSKKAVIGSTYAISEAEIPHWPQPYEGKFNLKGSLFAVMRNYRFNTIEGSGTAMMDLNRGILESNQQQWKVGITAEFLLPLGNSLPQITVNQSVTILHVAE